MCASLYLANTLRPHTCTDNRSSSDCPRKNREKQKLNAIVRRKESTRELPILRSFCLCLFTRTQTMNITFHSFLIRSRTRIRKIAFSALPYFTILMASFLPYFDCCFVDRCYLPVCVCVCAGAIKFAFKITANKTTMLLSSFYFTFSINFLLCISYSLRHYFCALVAREILFSSFSNARALNRLLFDDIVLGGTRTHRCRCCLCSLHVWKCECREHNDIYLPYDLRNCNFSVHSLSCSLTGARALAGLRVGAGINLT